MGNNRFIFNQAISIFDEYRNSPYITYNSRLNGIVRAKIYSPKGSAALLQIIEEQNPFLKTSHAHSKQNSIKTAAKAYSDFLFEGKGKPKFRKKFKNETLFLPNQNHSIEINGNKQWIKIKQLSTKIKKLIQNDDIQLNKNEVDNLTKFHFNSQINEVLLMQDTTITEITIKKNNERYFLSIGYKYEINDGWSPSVGEGILRCLQRGASLRTIIKLRLSQLEE
jgi:transposase